MKGISVMRNSIHSLWSASQHSRIHEHQNTTSWPLAKVSAPLIEWPAMNECANL